MEDLVDKSVDLDVNLTALHDAVKCGNEELVQSLINDGADVYARDNYGRTALYHAVREGHLRMVELLLNHKADIASSLLLHTAVETKDTQLVEYLLGHGADITASDEEGQTVLHEALHADMCMNYFLDRDDVLNELFDFTGKITRLLLQKGAQVNAKTSRGTTALHAAAELGCNEAIEALLEFKADVYARNADGKTALELAVTEFNFKAIETLLKYGDGVNSKGKNGKFVFHMAANRGWIKGVHIFLKRGANINGKDDCGKTALHYAVEGDYVTTASNLLASGASINCRDAFNETPLHIASYRRQGWMVDFLLANGADVTALTLYNETALDKAIKGYYMEDEGDGLVYDEYLNTVKQYIVMRDVANLFVRPRDLITVGDYNSNGDFRKSCKTEIEMSKTEMICSVSYYDILSGNSRKLAKSATYDDISQVFDSGELYSKFPIYGDMLRCQLAKLRFRAYLMEKYYDDVFFPFLYHCFPELPCLCTDIILTYLNNDDFKMMIEAWEPELADDLKLISNFVIEK